jgi:hypothetical protein
VSCRRSRRQRPAEPNVTAQPWAHDAEPMRRGRPASRPHTLSEHWPHEWHALGRRPGSLSAFNSTVPSVSHMTYDDLDKASTHVAAAGAFGMGPAVLVGRAETWLGG